MPYKNKRKAKAYNKLYYESNAVDVLEKRKDYYKENKDQISELRKTHYKKIMLRLKKPEKCTIMTTKVKF